MKTNSHDALKMLKPFFENETTQSLWEMIIKYALFEYKSNDFFFFSGNYHNGSTKAATVRKRMLRLFHNKVASISAT